MHYGNIFRRFIAKLFAKFTTNLYISALQLMVILFLEDCNIIMSYSMHNI